MKYGIVMIWCCASVLMTMVHDAPGAITSFTNAAAWQFAVKGTYSTLDFTDLPADTFVTDQYFDDGVTFTGINLIRGPTPLYQNDSWGLFGPNNIRFTFDSPQNWIAVDYPGGIKFQLFNQGTLIYTSGNFLPGGLGNFAGLVSDMGFDEVLLFKPPGHGTSIVIDDLHWGSAVPAPAGLTLLLFTAVHLRRRRS